VARLALDEWRVIANCPSDLRLHVLHKGRNSQVSHPPQSAVMPALNDEIGLLDRAVAKGGYLAGDSFTFADINVMPILYYLQKFPEPPPRSPRPSRLRPITSGSPRGRAFRTPSRRHRRRDRRDPPKACTHRCVEHVRFLGGKADIPV
jgi:glutathione S-transferase